MLTDIKFGIRQLLKYPGFTAIAVLTLALGIGVNTTMFSVLNALVFEASRAPDSERMVAVFRTSPQSQEWPHAPANYFDYERQQNSFARLSSYYWNNSNMAEPGQPAERLPSMTVGGEFFSVFGIPPELGRTIGPDDARSGATRVAVLSDGFWRDHFASDPNVVGRTLRMDGLPITVVGVMPPSMDQTLYWGHIDLWTAQLFDPATRAIRDNNFMQIIGRLKPGATIEQAQAEATAIASRLAHDYPNTNAQNGLRLASWNNVVGGGASRSLTWLCMALAVFVLLIACANLANLQLARMASRLREHAVRIALGATRVQLIRQLLVENVLLAALGGVLGTIIAAWGTKLIGSEIVISGVAGFGIPIDNRVLVFTLAASLVTGIVVGVVPAWIASKTDVNNALKQGARGSSGGKTHHRFRQALVVGELALALLLLAGAGYFVRGLQRFSNAETGWKPDGLIVANLSLPFNATYSTDEQYRAFVDKLTRKLTDLPGATQSTVAASLPISGFYRSGPIVVQGRAIPAKGKEPLTYYNPVSVGHFSTLGIRLLSGRDFDAGDRADTHPVAIINETMARVLWPGESALGKRFKDPGDTAWFDVVGVVNDVHPTLEVFRSSDTPFQTYTPLIQTPGYKAHWLSLAIRTSAPAPTVATALRAAVQQIDPDQPVYTIQTAREQMEQVTQGLKLVSRILGVFALIGLALSSVGIYGVISNVVAQRTTEIGIRMALGAQEHNVLWMVLGQGVRLSVIGIAIGIAASWGLVRVMDSMLPLIHGADPIAFSLVAVLLVAVALFACWLPARRAARVNPVVALRGD